MAHSKQAHKGSPLLPECPKITGWYTAEDMQFKVFCQGLWVCLSTKGMEKALRQVPGLGNLLHELYFNIKYSLFCQIIYSSIKGLFNYLKT